jgi:hypothetical protein
MPILPFAELEFKPRSQAKWHGAAAAPRAGKAVIAAASHIAEYGMFLHSLDKIRAQRDKIGLS